MRARLKPARDRSRPLLGPARIAGEAATPRQALEELGELREQHERGEITDEEFEQARERLRRY